MSHSNNSSLLFEEKRATCATWFLASRPKTLLVSFVPIFVGTSLASFSIHSFHLLPALSLFLSVLWIQIGMNLVNDALDFQVGKKYGKKLELQREHLLSPRQFLLGGYVSFGLAFLFGIPLIQVGGGFFAFLLLLSIALGYLYTGGPFPLSYTGVSEIFLLIFYGWVSTCSAYYLQAKEVNVTCFLAGTQMGLLSIVPLAVNNLRDHLADASVNKKTLAVRFGPYVARWEITLCSLFPFFLNLLWIERGQLWMALFSFLSLPFAVRHVRLIWAMEPSPLYQSLIAKSVISHLLFGCGLILGSGYAFFMGK